MCSPEVCGHVNESFDKMGVELPAGLGHALQMERAAVRVDRGLQPFQVDGEALVHGGGNTRFRGGKALRPGRGRGEEEEQVALPQPPLRFDVRRQRCQRDCGVNAMLEQFILNEW